MYELVSQEPGISVNRVLKLLNASKSGYYKWLKRTPSNQVAQKQEVKQEIQKEYDEAKQIYGAPK